MLRVAPLRPKRPSLIQEKIALNSTYASLDDLEILNTIGAMTSLLSELLRW
jgi:hypothetical protein